MKAQDRPTASNTSSTACQILALTMMEQTVSYWQVCYTDTHPGGGQMEMLIIQLLSAIRLAIVRLPPILLQT